MDRDYPSRSSLVRNTGLVLFLFSLGAGALLMFAVPSSCSVVTSFFVVFLLLLLVAGGIVFAVGQFLLWRGRRPDAD